MDITLKNLNQTNINLREVNNNITIFTFWATWCSPCIEELESFNEEYKNWKEKSTINFYAVSIDDNRSINKVKTLVYGNDWNFNVLLDFNQKLKKALDINSIPYLIIVRNQKIIYEHIGYSEGYFTELNNVIERLKNK